MIPCKECIVLAVCRQKSIVECDKLHEYLTHNSAVCGYGQSRGQFSEVFPKVYRFYCNYPTMKHGTKRVTFLSYKRWQEMNVLGVKSFMEFVSNL